MKRFFRICIVLATLALAQTAAQGQAQQLATVEQIATAVATAEKSATAATKAADTAAKAADSAAKAVSKTWEKPNSFFLYAIPIVVLLGSLMAIFSIRAALTPSSWSIADALSEEVQLPVIEEITDNAGIKTRATKYDKDNKPILVPELRASSSRLIALMGMIAILFLFIGFGVFAVFSFGSTGLVPEGIERVVNFLVAGLTLFAPYLINKFSSLFQVNSGGK